jgi:hypothetical protein
MKRLLAALILAPLVLHAQRKGGKGWKGRRGWKGWKGGKGWMGRRGWMGRIGGNWIA